MNQAPRPDAIDPAAPSVRSAVLPGLAIVAAAALLLMFLRPDPMVGAGPHASGTGAGVLFGVREVVPSVVRDVNPDPDEAGPQFQIDLSLDREAYVRLFTVDSKRQTRLMPLDEDGSTEILASRRTGDDALGPWSTSPNGDGVHRTHAILIVSEESIPRDRILEVIPDPLTEPGAEIIPALIRLCDRLQRKHGWTVQWMPIDV